MDTRKYMEYRNRINGSITQEQLNSIQTELHNVQRDQDKVDLLDQIEVKRNIFEKLRESGVKGSITSASHQAF